MTTRSPRRLVNRVASLALLAGLAGALAAPAAIARPADVPARHAAARAHSGPPPVAVGRPLPVPIRAGAAHAVQTPVKHARVDAGRGFVWEDAGIGAGVAVIGTSTLFLVLAAQGTRRRIRVKQA